MWVAGWYQACEASTSGNLPSCGGGLLSAAAVSFATCTRQFFYLKKNRRRPLHAGWLAALVFFSRDPIFVLTFLFVSSRHRRCRFSQAASVGGTPTALPSPLFTYRAIGRFLFNFTSLPLVVGACLLSRCVRRMPIESLPGKKPRPGIAAQLLNLLHACERMTHPRVSANISDSEGALYLYI